MWCVCVLTHEVQARCGLAGLVHISFRYSSFEALIKIAHQQHGYMQYGWPTYTAVDCVVPLKWNNH